MAEYRKDRYYWFKLKEDFFKRHDIKIIKSMPNGKDYVIFYLQLLCESLSHDGNLRFSDTIPYDEHMLAVITDTNIDIVRSAMKLFTELKMIEILDDKTIYMKTLQNMVGNTTIGAEKKQIQLQKRAELIEGGKKVENFPPEIDIEKEIDIENKDDDIKRVNIIKNLFSNVEEDERLSAEVDVSVLKTKVEDSDYLKGFDLLKFSWLNKHYAEIVAGKYRNFIQKKSENNTFSQRKYTEEELNSLFDNLDEIET